MDFTNIGSSFSQLVFFLGAFANLILIFGTQLLIHNLNIKRDEKNRLEMFKLKVFELRLNAAQTANQYLLRVNRQSARYGHSEKFRLVDAKFQTELEKLGLEAREWLDGQALILGDEIYQKVFYYLNVVGKDKKEELAALIAAQNSLARILKNNPLGKAF